MLREFNGWIDFMRINMRLRTNFLPRHVLWRVILASVFICLAQGTDAQRQGHTRSDAIWYSAFSGFTYSNMLGEGVVHEAGLYDYPANPRLNADAGRLFILGKKAGLGISFEFSHRTLLSLDVSYEEKGCKIPVTELAYSTPNASASVLYPPGSKDYAFERIRYISIPFRAEKQFRYFYFQMGMYTGIRLNAVEYGRVQLLDEKLNFRHSNQYALFDLGMTLGTGISYPLSRFYSLRLGVSGGWSVTGNNLRGITGSSNAAFYCQSLQPEIRLLKKIERRRCYGI